MISLVIRVIKQIKNDKRTMALLIFAPILVITLIYFIMGDSKYVPTVATVDMNQQFVDHLTGVSVTTIASDTDINKYLRDKKSDAVIHMDGKNIEVVMLEPSNKADLVMKSIKNSLATINPSATKLETNFVYTSSDQNTFELMGYVFLGVISFMFIFIISGMALVRERSNQTLERLLMTPITRLKVIIGYILGYGFFAVIQSTIVFSYAHYILKLQSSGSIFLCILVLVILAFVAVSFGCLASIFAESEFQVAQFIPVVIVPQIFFSGIIPVDTIPYGLNHLCYIMPLFYACTSLRMIMIEGASFINILPYISGLIVFLIILVILNTLALKKYRNL